MPVPAATFGASRGEVASGVWNSRDPQQHAALATTEGRCWLLAVTNAGPRSGARGPTDDRRGHGSVRLQPQRRRPEPQPALGSRNGKAGLVMNRQIATSWPRSLWPDAQPAAQALSTGGRPA